MWVTLTNPNPARHLVNLEDCDSITRDLGTSLIKAGGFIISPDGQGQVVGRSRMDALCTGLEGFKYDGTAPLNPVTWFMYEPPFVAPQRLIRIPNWGRFEIIPRPVRMADGRFGIPADQPARFDIFGYTGLDFAGGGPQEIAVSLLEGDVTLLWLALKAASGAAVELPWLP